jgi:hypothetical protein
LDSAQGFSNSLDSTSGISNSLDLAQGLNNSLIWLKAFLVTLDWSFWAGHFVLVIFELVILD